MTRAELLRSGVRREFHAPFWNSGGVGDYPADCNKGNNADFYRNDSYSKLPHTSDNNTHAHLEPLCGIVQSLASPADEQTACDRHIFLDTEPHSHGKSALAQSRQCHSELIDRFYS